MINQVFRGTSFVLVVLALLMFAVSEAANAKTTTDPNHKGWSGKSPKLKMVDWKPVKAKCAKCSKMVDQYNETITQLLKSRYWVKFWDDVEKTREKGKSEPFWPGRKDADITEFESKAVGANLELFELQQMQQELHRKLVPMLEQQAAYLQLAIAQCERTACNDQKPTKMKKIKIGGGKAGGVVQPDVNEILKPFKVVWNGPYKTNCRPCRNIAFQLNAVPGWLARAQMKLTLAETQLKYAELIEKSNKVKLGQIEYNHPDTTDYSHLKAKVERLRAELSALVDYFKKLLKQLPECEQKYCPAKAAEDVSNLAIGTEAISLVPPNNCPRPLASEPITVGANSEIGSSANFKDKAKRKAAGMAGKLITGALGLGGGGGKSQGPVTYKDPVKKKHTLRVRNKPEKRDLRTGAVFTENGLLVSTNIRKAPGKGTFQTIYLQNPRGWTLRPIGVYMYEIWQDWKLNVSWTRDTYVDGEHVKHEEGGWSESWREKIGGGEETVYAEVQERPLWEQLGFTTAVSGAKAVGTLFPVSPEMLAAEPINLVIHITEPKKDPVTTVPLVFELSLGNKGRVMVKQVEKTSADHQHPCANTMLESTLGSNFATNTRLVRYR